MDLAILLLSFVFSATGSYDSLRSRAEPITNLGRFLEAVVGDCASVDPAAGGDRRACKARVRRAQNDYRGRLMRVQVDEVASAMSLAGYDERKEAFRVDLIPFFSARGFGMSVGKPKRLNRDGLPVMRKLALWVKLPADTPAFVFRRNLERGMVHLELVVVPENAYRMLRAGRDPILGLEVALKGLRLVGARSGEVLAEHVYQK